MLFASDYRLNFAAKIGENAKKNSLQTMLQAVLAKINGFID